VPLQEEAPVGTCQTTSPPVLPRRRPWIGEVPRPETPQKGTARSASSRPPPRSSY